VKNRLYCLPGVAISILLSLSPSFRFSRFILSILGNNIGKNASIHSGVRFVIPNKITIGENSTINSNVILDARKELKIGANVMIGRECRVYTLGHDVDDPYFLSVGGRTIIGDYAVLFPNVLVMPGIEIGKGAVVFPGSVVTKNVEAFSVVGGNPAVFIRKRNKNICYNLSYKTYFGV
jgi:acetyltransferase-like isoleucine patch superfamily enzyme